MITLTVTLTFFTLLIVFTTMAGFIIADRPAPRKLRKVA